MIVCIEDPDAAFHWDTNVGDFTTESLCLLRKSGKCEFEVIYGHVYDQLLRMVWPTSHGEKFDYSELNILVKKMIGDDE